MKKTLTIILFLVSTLVAGAQEYLNYPDAYYIPAPGPEKYYADSIKNTTEYRSEQPKLRVNMSLGTSFTTDGSLGNGFQTWLAPGLSYRLRDNLDISVGVMFSNNYLSGPQFYSDAGSETANSWFTTSVYARGTWYVNKDLVVSSTILKSIDQTPQYFKNSYYDRNHESMSLSVNYRLSKAVQLGVNFNMDRGNNPWSYHKTRPFGMDPFSPYSPF